MGPSNNRNLYIAATTACLTAALFGYSIGFIGGVIVLPSFLKDFHLNDLPTAELAAARSSTVTTWLFGALVGVPLGVPVCSMFGRKTCLAFTGVLYLAGVVMQLGSRGNLLLFEAGRWVSGVGVGTGTLVSPMYISEISPPSERGMLMSGYQTVLQLSALIGFWGAFVSHMMFPNTSALQWELPVMMQLVPGVLLLVGTMMIPESPRYLAENEQHKEAEESLSWLRRLPAKNFDLILELGDIREAAEDSRTRVKKSFVVEASRKDVRKRLLVGVGLFIFQNMAGSNALNYYAPVIFMSAGFTSVTSSLFLTGLYGIVKLVSAVLFMVYFVHLKNNRFWLHLGCTICGLTMVVLAYFVKTIPAASESEVTGLTLGGVLSIIMVYLFAFFFGVGLGPIPWNICSEIFPFHINTQCCAITTCTQWLFQIVIAALTPFLLTRIGWGTYLVFAVSCFLCALWVYLWVPETSGVAVGRAMDELFGADLEKDGEEEDREEVMERTPLLMFDRSRRSSLSAYT